MRKNILSSFFMVFALVTISTNTYATDIKFPFLLHRTD